MSLLVILVSLSAVHRLHVLQYSEKAQLIYSIVVRQPDASTVLQVRQPEASAKFGLLITSYICSCRTSVLTEHGCRTLCLKHWSFWSATAIVLCDATTVWQTGFTDSAQCWLLGALTTTPWQCRYCKCLCVIFRLLSIKTPGSQSLKYCTCPSSCPWLKSLVVALAFSTC